MKKKPRLSFWQIWNMSFGFLGIQFGFALQNANVSRIFETLGADVGNLSLYWLAAPVTGLIVQPIIGYYSDNTWCRLGRRRPYFLFGAIFASLALLIMPHSPVLWMAVGMLWIMDASINISMEPFRAFVGDMLPNEQRTKGFAMQSFFIGTGAVVASALPYMMSNWLGISNTAPEGEIPPSVKFSFYIGAFAFISAVIWTVIRSKEYTPEELKMYSEHKEDHKPEIKTDTASEIIKNKIAGNKNLLFGAVWIFAGLIFSALIWFFNLIPELYIFSFGISLFGIIKLIAGFYQKSGNSKKGIVVIINDFDHMPKTMVQLAFVQFFSWFALFAMWIYTTPAITEYFYNTTDPTTELYNKGADWVGICFAVYNGFAAIVAFLLPVLAKATNRKITHMISLIAGGLGLITIFYLSNPNMILVSMLGVGLAWASILSMPYAILSGVLPAKKMGTYMGIFNFFIVIPQIVAAGILGFLIKSIFSSQSIYALILGGVSMFIAAALVLFVKDVNE